LRPSVWPLPPTPPAKAQPIDFPPYINRAFASRPIPSGRKNPSHSMSIFRRLFTGQSQVNMDSATKKAQQLIDDNAVMVFSKSWCPYCRNSKRILDGLNAKYEHYELDQQDDGSDIQEALLKLTGQRTVPNIFIGKQHIGGNSDLAGYSSSDLEKLLKDAGAVA